MTPEQRITFLESRIAQLEARIASLESKHLTFGPSPAPSPWPKDPYVYPWQPPYTVTCKMPDGTTKEITLDSPIVAQDAS
jgi:hypothetical protein